MEFNFCLFAVIFLSFKYLYMAFGVFFEIALA